MNQILALGVDQIRRLKRAAAEIVIKTAMLEKGPKESNLY